MVQIPFSNIRSVVVKLALILLVAGIGYRAGERRLGVTVTPERQIILNTNKPESVPVDFALFWDVWERLKRYHIDASSIDNQKMVWGAITGMVNSLEDPYTTFLSPKENKEFKDDLGGQFEGIGAQLGMKDNRVIVVTPLKGNPAEKAGIKPGDWILEVNDEETVGWTVPEAVAKIRGPKGTSVNLTILHESDLANPIDLVVTRAMIVVPAVEYWVKRPSDIAQLAGLPEASALRLFTKKIAYIHLSRFGDRLSEEWGKAVSDVIVEAKKGLVAGLVFDLRNNPGGYLEGAVYIGSEFVKSGVIVSQKNSDGTKQDYTVNRAGSLLDIPVVVLINKGSASAAEIVAGALKDFKRASIVGETSFGKGSVQTPQELSGGSSIHITTGLWLTPNGESISKTGITPDFEVKDLIGEATADAQLAKAVELLLQ